MMSDKKFAQIAFEFDASAGGRPEMPAENPAHASIPPVSEDAPVQVGVRLKALKEGQMPGPEPEMASAGAQQVPSLPSKTKSTRGRKSLKEGSIDAELLDIPGDDILFQRQYYSIGEVASMFRVNTSLIRFWEKEFDILQPRKNRKGDRHFRPVDIKNLQLIYDLLRRRKMTIEGAREFLKQNSRAQERFEAIDSLRKIRGLLLDLKSSL